MHPRDVELLAEYSSPHGPVVKHIRGSMVVSSQQTLRELSLYERYVEHVPKSAHDSVLLVLAASWVPVDVAMLHYAACDTMQLDSDELEKMAHPGFRW